MSICDDPASEPHVYSTRLKAGDRQVPYFTGYLHVLYTEGGHTKGKVRIQRDHCNAQSGSSSSADAPVAPHSVKFRHTLKFSIAFVVGFPLYLSHHIHIPYHICLVVSRDFAPSTMRRPCTGASPMSRVGLGTLMPHIEVKKTGKVDLHLSHARHYKVSCTLSLQSLTDAHC